MRARHEVAPLVGLLPVLVDARQRLDRRRRRLEDLAVREVRRARFGDVDRVALVLDLAREAVDLVEQSFLIGIDDSPAAEFAPVMIRMPPSNSFDSVVLPLSRERAGATFARSRGVSTIIGARRCFDQRSPTSTVGSTTSIELGAWSIV
jgi:hypothetical protein